MIERNEWEENAPLMRTRSVSIVSNGSYKSDVELMDFDAISPRQSFSTTTRSKWWPFGRRRRQHNARIAKAAYQRLLPSRRRRPLHCHVCRLLIHIPLIIVSLVIVCALFFPSYSNPPQRYKDLRSRVRESTKRGAANPDNEKIFIAASLYDNNGGLVSGDWGQAVLRLIDVLGPKNVFLSLYENDPSKEAAQALNDFHRRVPCPSSIVYEHLDRDQLPHVTMPDGSQRLKRIAFLAEVRNRALHPLSDVRSKAYGKRWDKLLYLNDVIFSPIDAANLLFNTNVDERTGKTRYRAACAVDFINPFKFYDTFATRDLEGYAMGVPFFPWLTWAGMGESRQDVLDQKDAVRVKSCWGGMVAFEAKWFQPQLYALEGDDLVLPDKTLMDVNSTVIEDPEKSSQTTTAPTSVHRFDEAVQQNFDTQVATSVEDNLAIQPADWHSLPPLRFRSEPDMYWHASECCLIHADLTHLSSPTFASRYGDTGIYMNPYIRVAYSKAVLTWLPFTKRFERLYTPAHTIVNWLVGLPNSNPRRLEQPGDTVIDRVWQYDEQSLAALRNGTVDRLPGGLQGALREVQRKAQPGQFCGSRKLSYITENAKHGESKWRSANVPSLE